MGCLLGASAPISACPTAGETGSPAHAAVGAYGAPVGEDSPQMVRAHRLGGPVVLPRAAVGAYRVPVGDGSPLRSGPTSYGDREHCPGGGPCP